MLEGLARDRDEKDYNYINKPATLKLLDQKGKVLASTVINPAGWEYIYIKTLGNNKTVIVTWSSGEGLTYGVDMYVRFGSIFKKVYSIEGGEVTGLADYAEDGSYVFIFHNGKRIILDSNGNIISEHKYPQQAWKGWVSPKGNYFIEITRGKYFIIYDKKGNVITSKFKKSRRFCA